MESRIFEILMTSRNERVERKRLRGLQREVEDCPEFRRACKKIGIHLKPLSFIG